MKRYEGKVAVVTASAAGIGEAIVERLIAEGAQVLATSRNGADALAERMGERCVSMKSRLTDGDALDEIFDMVPYIRTSFSGKLPEL